MNHSMLVLDIDGTVLDSAGTLSGALNRDLAALDGTLLAYATGRCYESAIAVLEKAALQLPDVLITDVGGRVYRFRNGVWALDELFESYHARLWKWVGLPEEPVCLLPQARPQETLAVRRLAYWADDRHVAQEAAQRLAGQCPAAQKAVIRFDAPEGVGPYWLDVLAPSEGKGGAVSYVASMAGVPHDHILAVGDSLNDLELLDGRFHAGTPARVTPALDHALSARKAAPVRASLAGPAGTRQIIHDRLPSIIEGLPLAENRDPNHLRNWGLAPGKPQALHHEPDRDAVLRWLSRGHNWWWEAACQRERARIVERCASIPRTFLRARLEAYARRHLTGETGSLLGALVSGSFLYGPEDDYASDLDLVLLFDGLEEAALGFEIDVPGLRNAFGDSRIRLRRDRVGLGIVDVRHVTPANADPILLQIAASMQGSGIPLFGQPAVDTPMGALDFVAQAEKLLHDADEHVQTSHDEGVRKVRLRCMEADRVVALGARGLNGEGHGLAMDGHTAVSSADALSGAIQASRARKSKFLLACHERAITGGAQP